MLKDDAMPSILNAFGYTEVVVLSSTAVTAIE
jgi:hypothetical protein